MLQNRFKIVSNEKISGRFYRMSLDAPSIVRKVRPGQFIHIRIQAGMSGEPFLRRPFSVYRADKYVEILYEVVGHGTALLTGKRGGEILDVLGPLGNYFSMPPKTAQHIVMIAGGIGIAPLSMLSNVLSMKFSGKDFLLLYGGRTKGHIYPMKEFKRNGCKIYVSTMDGSVGVKGMVSELFPRIKAGRERTFLYTCGPSGMMSAVQDFAKQHGLDGEAACEARMACGLGACLGCSIPTRSGYKTVCGDGPVFDLREVIF